MAFYFPENMASWDPTNTDNAPAINDALIAAHNAGAGNACLLGGRGTLSPVIYNFQQQINIGDGGDDGVVVKLQSTGGRSLKLTANPGVPAIIVHVNCYMTDNVAVDGNNIGTRGTDEVTGVIVKSGAYVRAFCEVKKFSGYGINCVAGSTGAEVSGTKSHHNSRSGLLTAGSSYCNFWSNYCYCNGEDGIDNGFGSNNAFYYNTCYSNGIGAYPGDTHGIILGCAGTGQSANSNSADHNECYSNAGSGIALIACGGSYSGNTVGTDNSLHGNSVYGVQVDGTITGIQVYYNTFQSNVSGAILYNGTTYNSDPTSPPDNAHVVGNTYL